MRKLLSFWSTKWFIIASSYYTEVSFTVSYHHLCPIKLKVVNSQFLHWIPVVNLIAHLRRLKYHPKIAQTVQQAERKRVDNVATSWQVCSRYKAGERTTPRGWNWWAGLLDPIITQSEVATWEMSELLQLLLLAAGGTQLQTLLEDARAEYGKGSKVQIAGWKKLPRQEHTTSQSRIA